MTYRRTATEFPTEKALQTYLRDHPKADPKNHSVRPKSKPSAPEAEESTGPRYNGKPSADKTSLKGLLKATDNELDVVLAEQGKTFAKITTGIKAKLTDFEPKRHEFNTYGPNEDLASKTFSKLSEAEKVIYVGGHEVGQHFQQKVLSKSDKKLHDKFFRQWTTSPGSYQYDNYGNWDHSSTEMQGLVSSLGVSGYEAPEDKEADEQTKGALTKARQKAATDPKLQAYVKKMYDFQQAYFKSQGIKEVTVYRGFQGQGVGDEPPPVGTPITVQTRELSSFTANADIAKRFGRVVEYKIPVERIFACSLVRPEIGSETYTASFDEAEFLVMGASDLTGKIISQGGPEKTDKTAASKKPQKPKKPFVLKITNQNEAWLASSRKKKKSKKHASELSHRVVERFVAASIA